MPQRKTSIKLPEVGECIEKLQILESSVSDEEFQVISEIKESLDMIKGKWKTLNGNYKSLFQEKTNYESEMEKMIQSISKMNEEKIKHLDQIRTLEKKLIDLEEQVTEKNRNQEIEKSELEEVKKELEKNISEILSMSKEISVKQNEFVSLREVLDDKEKTIVNMRLEKEALDVVLLEYKFKNDSLLTKINILSSIESKNKELSESIEELRKEKNRVIDGLEKKISTLEYEKEKDKGKFEDEIQILVGQKKTLENLLNELRSKHDKKSKCTIM